MSIYGVFSGPYFPAFGLNTEIYGLNLRIQSKYGKTRTRKDSVFGHFSGSATVATITHESHLHHPTQGFPDFNWSMLDFLVTLAWKMYPGKNKSEVKAGEQGLAFL